MSEAENLKVVQDGYAAFARGDVQTILNAVADDVVVALGIRCRFPRSCGG